jgi:hypothetical protein
MALNKINGFCQNAFSDASLDSETIFFKLETVAFGNSDEMF